MARLTLRPYKGLAQDAFMGLAGGTIGGIIHYKGTSVYLAGNISGIQYSTIADIILGIIMFIIGHNQTKYKILFYALGGALMGTGIYTQLAGMGILRQYSAPRSYAAAPAPANMGVARGSYLAPSGVIVNKHGTVPELAPGTYA